MLLASKDNYCLLKLADFGLSKSFIAGRPMLTACGTRAFTAPEVAAGGYDAKADVWSIGVSLIYW